ncbi:P-loop containing nucleoside triphosphate hydrolase protein [Gigaspora rosea]|uniref:P-loop containing nucleoside triphosphate hydrolase protein n=1 Tax=Gigaspora rosea TaxID=44941 RepID=A0A397VZ49_9GLOM|nr:P-loop containing nucleoside triphosphate hydrolase protein [Gigaspora rosea]
MISENPLSPRYKRHLEKDDLYVLNDERTAKILTDNFKVEWQKETQKIVIGKIPSLLKALYRFILKFVVDAYYANFNIGVQPLGMETGILSSTIFITAIYRKALVLNFVCGYFHMIWTVPIQICLLLIFLIYNIGPSAIAGFALLVLMGPIQGKVILLLARTRAKAVVITDERVKLIQEILLGIRAIKYYAWEDSFEDALNKIRNKEISFVRFLIILRASVIGVIIVIPVFASVLSFTIFSLTGGNLDTEIAFSSVALFYILRIPLTFLQTTISINPDEKYAIKVTDSSISFDAISDISIAFTPIEKTEYLENSPLLHPKSHLRNINISIPREKLIAIVGPVGSSKSSLLSALIGEMKRISGEVIFGENVGYCPQTAWIQNATLRDNITFELPFNYKKYQQVIKDCCLEPDLRVLPSGDLTEIGEKGINLSGEQKQHVNIARAVYYNADIILLDDPLSAVDTHIGRYLFTNCIKGALAKKTCLLVMHQLYYLPQVDYIKCMKDGEIAEQGTYEELIKNRKNFSKLIAEYGAAESNHKIKEDEESTLDKKANKKDQTVVLSKGLMSIEEQYIDAVNYKETDMNSVECLIYYCDNLEKEAENIVLENRPSSGWPAHREIHIKNLEIKYGPDSPLVLKGISIDIKPAEKIGIVGCGKSTLAMSFFRFIEATSRSIVIDNVDISTIELKDLRSNNTIIPQNPVLFNSTIRSNLDPFNKHSNLELWDALYRVHLIKPVNFTSEKEESEESEVVHSISDQNYNKQEPIMLDSPIKENGSNFSQGQHQLIAMARALIRHSKLIIIDEATASIDFKTDNLIQTTIRKVFKNSTVITIAHRLRTIADYDRYWLLMMEM